MEALIYHQSSAERIINAEIKKVAQDEQRLVQIHKDYPELADEVAKRFWYDNFEDALLAIDSPIKEWNSARKIMNMEVKKVAQDAQRLVEIHKDYPELADEVAKKFGYDDYEDALLVIENNNQKGEIFTFRYPYSIA